MADGMVINEDKERIKFLENRVQILEAARDKWRNRAGAYELALSRPIEVTVNNHCKHSEQTITPFRPGTVWGGGGGYYGSGSVYLTNSKGDRT